MGSSGIKRDGWALLRASSPGLTRVRVIGNRPISLWPLRSIQKARENYVHDPDFSYSEGRLPRQPRNRGATDGNILQTFSKSWRMTFHPLRGTTFQLPKWMTTVSYAWSAAPAVRDSPLIHYGNPAGQLTESTHHLQQVSSTNLGSQAHARRTALQFWRVTTFQVKGC